MRIVIKPGGLIILLVTLLSLVVGPLLWLRRGVPQVAQASVPPRTGAAPVPTGKREPSIGGSATPGKNLLPDATWKFYTELDAQAQQSRVATGDAGAIYHFDVAKVGANPWNVGFNNTLQEAFPAGETLRLHFRGRSTARSQICMLMQQTAPPFPHCWKEYLSLTPEWKEYDYAFPTAAYPKAGSLFSFFLGFGTGMIELADVRLERG